MRARTTRSILPFTILLLLSGCAAREAGRAPKMSEPAPPPPAPVEAPDSVMARERAGAPDPAAIRDSFAPAEPLTPQEAERWIVRRRAAAPRAKTAPMPQARATAESLARLDAPVAGAPEPEPEAAPAVTPARDANKAGAKRAESRVAEDALEYRVAKDEDDAADELAPSGELEARRPRRASGARLTARPTTVAAKTSPPARLVVEDSGGRRRPLEARAMRLVAHVQGARARTVLDLVFDNPTSDRLEGTFQIELPADATVAGFSVFDGAPPRRAADRAAQGRGLLPRLPRGFLAPRARDRLAPTKAPAANWQARRDAALVEDTEGRAAQLAAVRAGRPAASLGWGGGQTFTAKVFPIEPGRLKRLVVVYESPLPIRGGRARYALPPAMPEAAADATLFVHDARGRLASTPPGARVSSAKGWTRVELGKSAFAGALELALPEPQSVLRSAAGPGIDGDTFYARIPVEVGGGEAEATGRAIFVVDTSASELAGGAARRAALLERLLTQDTSVEQYAVLLFDVRARWLHGVGFRDRTPAAVEETLAELRKVYFEGATNLGAATAALERARAWAVDGAPTTVFLLSDGQVTWGEEDPARLAAESPALRDVRLIAYRFDAEPSRAAVLAGLARHARAGQVVSVSSAGEASSAADAHRFSGARLLGVEVFGAPSADVVVDGAPTTLHPGQVLTVAGRLPSGGDPKLVVRYALAGREARLEVPLGAAADADPLAATGWAELFVRQLETSQDPRLDGLLAAMGRRFSLANRKASFVVVDAVSAPPAGVDVSNLLREVEQARAASRRAAEGLSSRDLSPDAQALLTELRRRSDGPPRGQPLLWAPRAGASARRRAEAAYRAARAQGASDMAVFERIARTRALAGDTAGAIRALSTVVELSPHAPGALRTVGYALLALGQYPAAAELLSRLRRLRPFEPQAWLEEALALEAAGRLGEAGLRYERLLVDDFGAQTPAARRAATAAYATMLQRTGLPSALPRRAALARLHPDLVPDEPPHLAVRALGAEVPADVDLWVYEPDGVRCSAERPEVPGGGRLLIDGEGGAGPDLYRAPKTRPGAYDVLVHYRRGPAYRPGVSSGVLVIVDRAGAPRRFATRLLDVEDAVLLVRTERF